MSDLMGLNAQHMFYQIYSLILARKEDDQGTPEVPKDHVTCKEQCSTVQLSGLSSLLFRTNTQK